MVTKWGPATVVNCVASQALVTLKSGLKVKLPITELTPESKIEKTERTSALPEAASERRQAPMDARISKLKAIEVLRFGLVSEDYIEELTLGFTDLKKWVLRRLPGAHNGRPQVSEITGPFGTGKSHMMAVIRHVARNEGYVTARVEVDGQYISLSDPAKLLCSIWSSFSAKNFSSSTPLLDLYLKAIDAGYRSSAIAPEGMYRIKDNYTTIRMLKNRGVVDHYVYELDALISSSDEFTASELSKRISSELSISWTEFSLRPMIGRTVEERPDDFVESLVGHTRIAELAGYKGLILTIDEFEVEHNLSKEKLQRVVDLIRALTGYFTGSVRKPIAPLGIFFASVGEEGHVGDAIIDFLIEKAGGEYYRINPWPRGRRLELARVIHRLYCDAYGLEHSFDRRIVDEIERGLETDSSDIGLIRMFIKRYVAKLDSLFGPPGGLPGGN